MSNVSRKANIPCMIQLTWYSETWIVHNINSAGIMREVAIVLVSSTVMSCNLFKCEVNNSSATEITVESFHYPTQGTNGQSRRKVFWGCWLFIKKQMIGREKHYWGLITHRRFTHTKPRYSFISVRAKVDVYTLIDRNGFHELKSLTIIFPINY